MVGVDTHKHLHVAAVMDTIGGILARLTIPTDTGGFRQLADWAASFGTVLAFGIEGTGSYGATLTSFLRRSGHKVVEAGRPDRRLRRMNGKSDTLDAENAARAVLAGFATATPKTADGEAEMIRSNTRTPTTSQPQNHRSQPQPEWPLSFRTWKPRFSWSGMVRVDLRQRWCVMSSRRGGSGCRRLWGCWRRGSRPRGFGWRSFAWRRIGSWLNSRRRRPCWSVGSSRSWS
ncbi:transposase [Streptomyces sp. TLI_171]|uniref:IS110 family transposase n=1 Tax=Streptomyces sp. TLI_171 TaxID=1938859 RepID=UPI0028777BA8|nr:transposase [Streptomyces sp. TLI_171]